MARRLRKILVTDQMAQTGFNVLCDWTHPDAPVCELPPQAIEAAYIAMVRARSNRRELDLGRPELVADPHGD